MTTQPIEAKKEDIILDIYMYERILSSDKSISINHKKMLEDKIKEAEELFKSIK